MAIKQIGIRQQGGGYIYSDIGANSANIDVPNGGSTQSLDAALLAINTEIDTNKTNTDAAIATKAAINHADATGTAGKGTASNFGHVKMGAGINTAVDGVVAVAYGTAANTACQGNDARLSDKRTCPNALTAGSVVYDGSAAKTITAATLGAAPTNHASTGTSYGVGDASNYGHVKAGTGITSTSGVLSVNYGTAAGTACQGNDARLSDARTPISHATSATTYGIGNATNYGHVKVSDAYATSDGTASQGVSASSYAVNQAYNELNSKLIDYIIEEGVSTFWKYTKWASGTCVAEGEFSVSYDAGTLWGNSLYFHRISGTVLLPFTFYNMQVELSKADGIIAVHIGTTKGVAGGDFYFYIMNSYATASLANANGAWYCKVSGRWKA